MYYYIPQNAWGLVDQEHYDVAGFYSQQGGGCRPVALWCEGAQRGAYTHFDGNLNAVSQNLMEWLADNDNENTIMVYTADVHDANAILAQLNAIGYCTCAIVEGANQHGFWGCHFTDAGPAWVDEIQIPEDDKTMTPGSWSNYWFGAPEWMTFNSAIIDSLTGFIANYNGRFYFDFDSDSD
jgi:hypothetical protein